MSYGKAAVAPCGHAGEHIIGNYVACLVGCDSVSKKITRRGQPRHVNMCACKACQIRRRATHLVLRNGKGQDLQKVEWNGLDDEIKFVGKDGFVKHFRFLDKDGDIVASGNVEADIVGGYEVKVKINFMLDSAGMVGVTIQVNLPPINGVKVNSVKPLGFGLPGGMAAAPPPGFAYPAPVPPVFVPSQAPAPPAPVPPAPTPGFVNGIALVQALEKVVDVERVSVSPGYTTLVDLLEVTPGLWSKINSNLILQDMEKVAKGMYPGARFDIADMTIFGRAEKAVAQYIKDVRAGIKVKADLVSNLKAYLAAYNFKTRLLLINKNAKDYVEVDDGNQTVEMEVAW